MQNDAASRDSLVPTFVGIEISDGEGKTGGTTAEPRRCAAHIIGLVHSAQRAAHGVPALQKLANDVLRYETGRARDDDWRFCRHRAQNLANRRAPRAAS